MFVCGVLAIGCGRVGYDPRSDAVDASLVTFDAAPIDARVEPSDAALDAPSVVEDDAGGPLARVTFATPVRIDALSSETPDVDPCLTPDELAIYFASDRAGSRDLYVSRRESLDAPWSAPAPIAELNTTAANETDPWISPDERTLYFTTNASGTNAIWVARRASADVPFEAPTMVALDVANACCATLSSDELTMMFSAVGPLDLYVVTRASVDAPWSASVAMTSLNTIDDESNPSLSELVVFDRGAADVRDLWIADLATSETRVVGGTDVNTASDERDPWLADGPGRLYFASSRLGQHDLYVAERN